MNRLLSLLFRKVSATILLVGLVTLANGMASSRVDSLIQKQYISDLQRVGRSFIVSFRQQYVQNYSLPEDEFLLKIDSARALLTSVLNQYRSRLDTPFIQQQEVEIHYYFDRFLADYPDTHATYTGRVYPYHSLISRRLEKNLPDFNRTELLMNSDFTDYVRSFYSFQINHELQKPAYKNTDNQDLRAIWKIIPRYVTNKTCREFWYYDFLSNHIENKGIKDINPLYKKFITECQDTARLHKITQLYEEDYRGRQDHLIKSYKKIGPCQLDLHVFLPNQSTKKCPVKVYFHGGSWSEGKPDWFFDACKRDAQQGWVACAVEYRIYGRHRTLPFEAVKDARSAIRWLRQHAAEYFIDTSRIVACGNSAGGHLVLTCAMADQWNEKTDDLHFSAAPNVLMVNSGVYDLTDQATAWIRRTLKNKDLVKQISPNYLVRPGLPPLLAIHGTQDGNVSFSSAKQFEIEMLKASNPLEFHALEGASHFIWLDKHYSPRVTDFQHDFLKKRGY